MKTSSDIFRIKPYSAQGALVTPHHGVDLSCTFLMAPKEPIKA